MDQKGTDISISEIDLLGQTGDDIDFGQTDSIGLLKEDYHCGFPYKSRVMGTSEPLKPLKAPYMARNPVKWGFFRLKGQEIPLKI